ncbi:flagella basal body P-ring formation protein FlgA [Marinicauda salina]|jgi:flagella basal body P-ring formation protein FlgA|uniref:Flagella basal body P-ring formation protein FlgA n=1 Tax=Marinicauda salina TaxID=2135793 RepID=A0A2U2BUB9_9PROT|nr:flagellar basal body P-ring formation chaperone FlgA [Marinicauda salina]PWE17554.1 flagella basal body P-ring formation protein FlgA [Marinicauda salina]
MARLLACLIVLAATAAAPALADDAAPRTVVLKERLVSDDHVITLSDIFENAGEAGATMIARAPAPGERLSLDPDYVRREAAGAGLDWANGAGVQRVTVERAGRAVGAAEIRELIATALYAETGRAHEVELSNRNLALYAPVDSAGAPELVSLDTDSRAGLFRAEIAPWPDAEPVTVSGRAETVVDVPVLARPYARGEVIAEADIEWIRLPADRIRSDAVLEADAMAGMEARRSLRAGEALRGYDLSQPAAIARGETVALVYQVANLTLTARARALEDAPLGEPARFMNLQSNRTIEAVVEAPGRARVGANAAF